MKFFLTITFIYASLLATAQRPPLKSFAMINDVAVTIDAPPNPLPKQENCIILYALPNGNSTAQTIGKKAATADDTHFDIQHIGAQTRFLRTVLSRKNLVVVYLENAYKSWPQWKAKHPDYVREVQHIVDTVFNLFPGTKSLYLNGHSGGGRFIFSYLDGLTAIPAYVANISFLDSNYGYDSSYLQKLSDWLSRNKGAHLNVFAYNDSVALLNGKRFVSDTGGTWYRSGLMLRHFLSRMRFEKCRDDSLIVYRSKDKRVHFFLRTNPDRKIYHTQQVEYNGFIHALLAGTVHDEKRYRYFGKRAYTGFIE